MAAPSKAEIRATYERIAVSFASTRREAWPEVRAFVESLPRGSRILDLGSGNGRHAKFAASVGHPTIALDFSRRLLGIGRDDANEDRRSNRLEWVEGEATNIPLRAGAIDAALCVAVLHHLPTEGDRIAALVELGRVMRPGAPAILSAWAREGPRSKGVAAGTGASGDVDVPWTLPDGSVVPRFYHLFQAGELERLIIDSGLHGERFFRSAGNWFALARTDG